METPRFFLSTNCYTSHMDIFAHTLWANAGARAANTAFQRKGKSIRISPGWTGFWGMFPDFFAFTIPFLLGFYQLLWGTGSLSDFSHHRLSAGGFDIAAYLYQYSHSLVIWFGVFIVVWIIKKRPQYELFGWALHILIDIPSHAINFYPTPFLFPISEYRFPYGISWSNTWYMLINYTLLATIWGSILISKFKQKRLTK